MKLISHVQSIFLHGLFVLLPIAVTYAIMGLLIHWLHTLLLPIYNLEPQWLQQIPFSEFFIAILLIFLLGLIFDYILKEPLHTLERAILHKIPLVNHIYKGSKELVKAFNPQDKITFKTVVMIEFPRPGSYSIGFVAGPVEKQFSSELTGDYYGVFVPAVPNPTAGHYIVVAAHECKVINISRQDAITFVISGGIIQPGQFESSK